jgi:hypothetical protein
VTAAVTDRPRLVPAAGRRRLEIELTVLVCLLVLYAIVFWKTWRAPTRANYQRIQNGMTRAEVESILGPPGDYRSWGSKVEFPPLMVPPNIELDRWASDNGVMGVRYINGKVVESYFNDARPGPGMMESFFQRLKDGYGRRVGR